MAEWRICLSIVWFCVISNVFVNSSGNGNDIQCAFDINYNFTANCVDVSLEYFCTLRPDKQCWLYSLYKEATSRNNTYPLRKRREIRTLSEAERKIFFDAVNTLKEDKSVEPNKYDVLAMLHKDRTLCSVHRGANFLGWHRVYMLLIEEALREVDASITLPYWDWLIDNNNVTLPNNTIIFTDTFLGNGYGAVTSGPFKDWKDEVGCSIYRNLGSENTSIPTLEVINMIKYNETWKYGEQIVDGGSTFQQNHEHTLEGQHNMVHDWVGKAMAILATAPKDPAFFLHHAHIDYIWEKFRQKQKSLGIDPEKDYPNVANEEFNLGRLHVANRTMDCFFWMKNYEGYSNIFTDSLYTYEDTPACPDCGQSPFLRCSEEEGRCIGIIPGKTTSGTNRISFYTLWMIGCLFCFSNIVI